MNNLPRVKIILLGFLGASLAACAVPGKYSASKKIRDDCANGSTYVDVKYGDSYLQVNPRANVKRDAAFEFRLKAKQGYGNAEVTIEGKSANDSWIVKTSGTANDNKGKLSICVPASQARGEYYYKVTVEDIGELDPRADVT